MSRWVVAAEVADCPPGAVLEAVVESRVVAIFNVAGRLHALDGICPHQGGPLGQGKLDADVVTCPWHGWQFSVATGQHTAHPGLCQARFPVRVEQDTILVDAAAFPDTRLE
jgi:nitrite reductase (NADH) small subunit